MHIESLCYICPSSNPIFEKLTDTSCAPVGQLMKLKNKNK